MVSYSKPVLFVNDNDECCACDYPWVSGVDCGIKGGLGNPIQYPPLSQCAQLK